MKIPGNKIVFPLIFGLIFILTACVSPAGPVPETGDGSLGYAELVAALQTSGATVEPISEIEQPFFPVKGQTVRVNWAEIQVFEFASVEDRERISSTISANGSQIGTFIPSWIDRPNFWAEGRLIVLYLGEDKAILDLLNEVLGEPITTFEPSNGVPSDAVLQAQNRLAQQLNIAAEQVEIVSYEQQDWTDSCLGLGGPAESCAAVITPGWLVILQAGGQEYEVRTDETGSAIRIRDLVGDPGGEASLETTRWVLESYGAPGAEAPVVGNEPLTLEFDGAGRAGGSGGCNTFGVDYEVQGNEITFGELVSTLRACAEPALNEQEQRYYEALQDADRFEITGGQLTIWYAAEQGMLNFAAELAP